MLWLLLALLIGDGTPHYLDITCPAVMVQDVNPDGTPWIRPAIAYNLLRAPIVNGVQGAFVQVNDALIIGMVEADGTADPVWYEDTSAEQGATYVYAMTAVDLGGESAPSAASGPVTMPVNPGAATNFSIVRE